jgi:hypothetical protein
MTPRQSGEVNTTSASTKNTCVAWSWAATKSRSTSPWLLMGVSAAGHRDRRKLTRSSSAAATRSLRPSSVE